MKYHNVLIPFITFIILTLTCGTKRVLYKDETYFKLPNGLIYRDIAAGKGEIFKTDRDWAIVKFKGSFEDGTNKFETNFDILKDNNKTNKEVRIYTDMKAGRHRAHEVLLIGALGMRTGGLRRLIIPPHLHIGQNWIPFDIRGKRVLVVDIRLMGISPD